MNFEKIIENVSVVEFLDTVIDSAYMMFFDEWPDETEPRVNNSTQVKKNFNDLVHSLGIIRANKSCSGFEETDADRLFFDAIYLTSSVMNYDTSRIRGNILSKNYNTLNTAGSYTTPSYDEVCESHYDETNNALLEQINALKEVHLREYEKSEISQWIVDAIG